MFPYQTIRAYHDALFEGETDCVATVQHFLGTIKSNQHLNAFTEVYQAAALAQAEQLDKSRNSGQGPKRLHGVVIALKDVISYKGHRLTAASRILENFTSVYTASAVQYLLDEEAIIIGSCNCDEFAMGSTNEHSAYGPVLNAIDNTKVPGGSSGGSAVSVQAGMCMVSLGSDTGGSVRQPANFCGIAGFKPGYGRVSRYGLIAYASSFDQLGIFAKNTEDIYKVLEIMSIPDSRDSTMNASPIERTTKKKLSVPIRYAYFTEALEHPSLDIEVARSIKEKIEELREQGNVVEPVSFPLLDYVVPTYYVLTTAEASSNLSRYDGVRYGHRSSTRPDGLADFYMQNRSEGFGKEVKRRIMLGTFVLSAGFYDAYFTKAQQVRQLLITQTEEIFKTADVILMPCSPSTAFALGETEKDPIAMYLADIFTVFANLAGLPAISIPLFQHSNGMPFGLQLMAAQGQDGELLEVSDSLMQQKLTSTPSN